MSSKKRTTMSGINLKKVLCIPALVTAILMLAAAFLLLLVPINIHAEEFWVTIIITAAVYGFISLIFRTDKGYQTYKTDENGKIVGIPAFSVSKESLLPFGLAGIMTLLAILGGIIGAQIFHAKGYAGVLQIQDAEFTEDLPESFGTDSIALMDTKSAKMLGDREIGSLSNVVSQYDVSDSYTQIDYQGKPLKVAALEYAGFFKWFNNKSEGVPGYVTVNPVSMSADYKESAEGMIYVPSAYLLQDAGRHLWLSYPTTMWGNLHFEIDEEGNPYYVASVYKKTIGLFGGTTVSGCIVLNPVTGETVKYSLEDVPTWVDMVFPGDLLCTQYNWYGNLQNGFLNSIFAKKGCKQVTSYQNAEDTSDEAPISDYGYVAKDGDIWIYTGVTSVNSDSSNIGFLLANERTGEAHYFTIAGADEKSAMAAAEGEVQEKRYQASFPSLINVDGNPTYIMVLKDASGLVKLYAAVNVEQYNLVTTASSQVECITKYRKLLGLADASGDASSIDPSDLDDLSGENGLVDEEETLEVEAEADITIAKICFVEIDGNTYIYLITDQDEIFKAKVKLHEDMLLLEAGDQIHIGYNNGIIVEFTR